MKSKLASAFIVILMIQSAFGFLALFPDNSFISQVSATASSAYPNSDWLILWQRPTGKDPPPAYQYGGEGAITPIMNAQFYGSNTFQVMIPGYSYWANIAYSWEQLNDSSYFPIDSKIYVGYSNYVEALAIATHAIGNPRIVGGWQDDFIHWEAIPTDQIRMHDLLAWEDGNLSGGRTIKNYYMIYQDSYYRQSPTPWIDLLPAFDGIWFSCLERVYDVNYYRVIAWEDAVKDMANLIPGKDIYAHIYNHHYNNADYQFDYIARQLYTSAKLYREGVIRGISLLEGFWIQHNPIESQQIANILNIEFANVWNTTIDLGPMSITTTKNGIANPPASFYLTEKWTANYSFWSGHAQNITFLNAVGDNITVRNDLSGETYELTETPEWTFISEPACSYTVFSWPHTHLAYGDISIDVPTEWNDRQVFIDGLLQINSALFVNRSVIQFGLDHYQDTVDNNTISNAGVWIKNTGDANITFWLHNSVIEPIHREFPWSMNGNRNALYEDRVFNFANSTIAVYGHVFDVNGYIYLRDCVFYEPTITDTYPTAMIVIPDLCKALYIERTVFWMTNGYNTDVYGVADTNMWAQGIGIYENNTYAGGRRAMWFSNPDMVPQLMFFRNCQFFRTDYNVTNDIYPIPATYEGHQESGTNHPLTYTRYAFSGSNSPGDIVNLTSKFKLKTPINLTGILRDANGNAIGTYSNNSVGEVCAWNITEVQYLFTIGINYTHPFPWTFEIITSLPSDHAWGIRSINTLGANMTMRFDPWLIPFENNTFTIYPEESTSYELVERPDSVPLGVPVCLDANRTVHMGKYIHAWGNHIYNSTMNTTMYANASTASWIDITTYATMRSDYYGQVIIGWTVTGAGILPNVTYSVSGLDSQVLYRVLRDGNLILLTSGPIMTFVGIGNGSYELTVWYPQTISNLVFLTFDMLAIGVLAAVAVVATEPLRDKKNQNPAKYIRVFINLMVYIIIVLTLFVGVHKVIIG